MRKQHFFNESGQTLVIIAFAAIGLFAFAALAIDGSVVMVRLPEFINAKTK